MGIFNLITMSNPEQEHIVLAISMADSIIDHSQDMNIQNEMIEAIRKTILDRRRKKIEDYEAKIREIQEASGI